MKNYIRVYVCEYYTYNISAVNIELEKILSELNYGQ